MRWILGSLAVLSVLFVIRSVVGPTDATHVDSKPSAIAVNTARSSKSPAVTQHIASVPSSKPPAQQTTEISVSDQCTIKYIGSLNHNDFNTASSSVREKAVDCIGYYYDHKHRFPTEAQLAAYSAAQDRDYERHLSRSERKLRDEYAIGEAMCRGDEACVERGVDANQAIDKLEDQMNSENPN